MTCVLCYLVLPRTFSQSLRPNYTSLIKELGQKDISLMGDLLDVNVYSIISEFKNLTSQSFNLSITINQRCLLNVEHVVSDNANTPSRINMPIVRLPYNRAQLGLASPNCLNKNSHTMQYSCMWLSTWRYEMCTIVEQNHEGLHYPYRMLWHTSTCN